MFGIRASGRNMSKVSPILVVKKLHPQSTVHLAGEINVYHLTAR